MRQRGGAVKTHETREAENCLCWCFVCSGWWKEHETWQLSSKAHHAFPLLHNFFAYSKKPNSTSSTLGLACKISVSNQKSYFLTRLR